MEDTKEMNKRIKILFFLHDLGRGGAEKVCVNLVNNLNPQVFDVHVISMFAGGENETLLKPGIHYRTIFEKTFRGNCTLMKGATPKQLHKFFIKDHYDIEVALLEGPPSRIVSGCVDPNTKLVSWIHSSQDSMNQFKSTFRNVKETKRCYERFDEVVCVSNSVRKAFCSAFPQINPKVLYNVAETEDIRLQSKEKLDKNELFPKKMFKICGIGKIEFLKGFDRFAQVHVALRQKGLSVHSYILGKGNMQNEIENFLKVEGYDDCFTFLGHKNNPYKYLANCDMFLCTSRAEGFSTAATEALILGIPVVTTPVAGMQEMLGKNNEYGIITKNDVASLTEACIRLIEDKKLCKKMKGKALERGKTFLKETTVQNFENFFIDLSGVSI